MYNPAESGDHPFQLMQTTGEMFFQHCSYTGIIPPHHLELLRSRGEMYMEAVSGQITDYAESKRLTRKDIYYAIEAAIYGLDGEETATPYSEMLRRIADIQPS